jgi:5-hydroxyisourate hydrolase-like protein (transthyretin family)
MASHSQKEALVDSNTPNSDQPAPGEKKQGRRWWSIALKLAIILAVVLGFAALYFVATIPERLDDQQTMVLGRTRFAPGSEAAVRVVVRDFASAQPVPGAQVKVSMRPQEGGEAVPLFEGQTDETGSLPVNFRIPADAATEQRLIVETGSASGSDRVEQAITVQREYKLLLSSDKPLYQPGQVIHMRALGLSALDMTPARGAEVNFLVEDPKGNKVFRKTVTASDFGVAAADFTLADLVIHGDYKLSVSIGDTTSEKTVEVKPYVLPKFAVQVSTERSFYLPGEVVEGAIQADYFFGKPVTEGQVELIGSVYDVERQELVDLRGETDENGTYQFSFELPAYFAASGLETGQAQFALEVTVIDQADHPEQTSLVLPIAQEPLIIEAIAESGQLKPQMENIVYILTAYPDGLPAQTRLSVSVEGQAPVKLETGKYGLAEFKFTPERRSDHIITIEASDETGRTASRTIHLSGEVGADAVLLRADRAAYIVGETMQLTALTPVGFGDIYLDMVKEGQTLSTRSDKVSGGKVEFAVDLTPELFGTLELHAYKVLEDGTIVRDTRVVVVDAPRDLSIAIAADQEQYKPGDPASITFETTNDAGGVPSALGVAIVDESVFALQRQDPGFAKLYFLLEKELLEPKYQIKGFELPTAIEQKTFPEAPSFEEGVGQARLAQDTSAKAAWASLAPEAFAMQVDSYQEKLRTVRDTQSQGYETLGNVTLWAMILIPPLLWVVVILALRRAGILRRSLKRLAIATLIILIVGVPLICSAVVGGLDDLFDADLGELLAFLLLALPGLGLLVMAVYAWWKKDEAAKYIFLLLVAWVAFIGLLLAVTGADYGTEPSETLAIVTLLVFLLTPGALLLFGQGRWVEGRKFAGVLSTGLGLVSALPALLIIPALLFILGVGRMGGVPLGAMAPPAAFAPQPTTLLEDIGEGQTKMVEEEEAPPAPGEAAPEAKEAPRLRQFFPETLYWNPELVTDEGGVATLDLDMADSITTWRLTALASSQKGELGFATSGIRVFQDFFVDIDLPVFLTQNDEIAIPIGIFNYLPEAQNVRLEVKEENWFELLDPAEKEITIASNDIDVVYFRIRVLKFGRRPFTVTAWGERMSDAIQRQVTVVPDGKEMRASESDWLRESLETAVEIPAETIPETPVIEVKIYPGVLAQVVEGLEKILRLPHG